MRPSGDGRLCSFRIVSSTRGGRNFGTCGYGITTNYHDLNFPPLLDLQVYYSMFSFFLSLVACWTFDDVISFSVGLHYMDGVHG
jgi:hypothetical protein